MGLKHFFELPFNLCTRCMINPPMHPPTHVLKHTLSLRRASHVAKSTQLGVRAMGFASAAGPNASFSRRMALSNACSTLHFTLTSEMYSHVLRSETQAQCFVRAGEGLSTTCMKSDQRRSGTGARKSQSMAIAGGAEGRGRGRQGHKSPIVMSPVHFCRTRSEKERGSSCKSQSCRRRS
jgi:hypothetical protein